MSLSDSVECDCHCESPEQVCSHVAGTLADVSAVVFVEGDSDRAALEALAVRVGRDFVAEDVSIAPMGGASSLGDFLLTALDSIPLNTTLAGLCDEGEAGHFCRVLERAGLGSNLSVSELESLGFFVCSRDLEDELIRSLGFAAIERVLTEQRELAMFRKFQNQPHWRGRPPNEQFHRFTGIKSGRKVRYGRVLVEALDLNRVPCPLEGLLAFIQRTDSF